MGFLSSIGKGATKILDVVATTFTHPIQVAKAIVSPTKTVQQVVNEHFSQSVTKQNVETLITTAGYLTVLSGAASIATKGFVGAAKAIIPKTLKGKFAGVIIAPVVTGVAIANPELALNTLSIPQNLGNVGINAGNFAKNPSLENFLNIYKENPLTAGALTLIPAAIAAKTIIPTINNARQTDAINDQTKAIEKTTDDIIKQNKKTLQLSSGGGRRSSNNVPTQIIINNIPYSPPTTPAVVAPSEDAPAGVVPIKTTKKKAKPKKKTTKKKAKPKKKTYKKTRRSKKKTIKRKKHK